MPQQEKRIKEAGGKGQRGDSPVRAVAELRLPGLDPTRFFPRQTYLQALREEAAAAREAAPATETCRYFTNLNPRTTSVAKAHFGSGAGTGGLSVVGRGQ